MVGGAKNGIILVAEDAYYMSRTNIHLNGIYFRLCASGITRTRTPVAHVSAVFMCERACARARKHLMLTENNIWL